MTSRTLFETAAPEALGFAHARLQRIEAMLTQASSRRHLPGAVAMVVRRGKVVLQGSVGIQDANTGAPMSMDSLFRVYSMTKPIVSVAVMMLAEQGRVLPAKAGLATSVPMVATMAATVFSDFKVM